MYVAVAVGVEFVEQRDGHRLVRLLQPLLADHRPLASAEPFFFKKASSLFLKKSELAKKTSSRRGPPMADGFAPATARPASHPTTPSNAIAM